MAHEIKNILFSETTAYLNYVLLWDTYEIFVLMTT